MRSFLIVPRCVFLLLSLYLLVSCEEQTDWILEPDENGKLVVEAIITNEYKRQEIRLSLSYNELNGIPTPVPDAIVKLKGGSANYEFDADPNDPGKYRSRQFFSARENVLYQLDIAWNGNHYIAENKMEAVLPFQRITFKPAGTTDSLTIDEVAPLYAPNEQAMYEITIDWSTITNDNAARVKLFYYTFRTIDINELFRPPKETIVFPRGSLVIEKKYSLNPEFAAYIRALLMETEWQGGILDEDSASLPTNISNGGLGFFGVCAVLSDSFIAQ